MATLTNTTIRRNNTNNITYILKKYSDNTYVFTTLVLRSGCYIVSSRVSGICTT